MKIPKYKRDRYTFISNLKEVTANRAFPSTLKRNGYLLSEYYTDTFHEDLAKWVKGRRNLLISDNGNFSRMKDIAEDFIQESERLLELAQTDGPTDDILRQRRQLMERVAARCEQELLAQDKPKIIRNQLKIKPDYLIALEDLTIPVLMICGLFDPVFGPLPSEISAFQEKTKELYINQTQGHYGSKEELAKVHKFHVIHSFNFASAKQGASLISQFNPDGVAISFGGALKSRRWIQNWNLGDHNTVVLPEKLPEMYLAIASISLGYLEGNPADVPVHILGVGSPILIALLGWIFHQSKAVSVDSTAPFKDAFQSKLYGSRYGFLKMDMYKVAAYSLIDNEPYTSTTPFFREFELAFPHNWGKLRAELGVSSSSQVRELAATLERETALVEEHIPFFSKMRAGNDPLINHLRVARSGHNYWILHCICNAIKDRKEDLGRLQHWTEYQVNRYEKVAHPKWSKTVEVIFNETVARMR